MSESCPTGSTQRWLLEQSAKASSRPGVLTLVHSMPGYDPLECVPIPPTMSTGGIDLGPAGETVLQIGLRAFDVATLGVSSPLTSPTISSSRLEDRPTPSLALKSQEVTKMNGNGFFSDLFSDIGAGFSGETGFLETLGNVGSDIWGGARSLLPSFPTLAQSFLPALPLSGQPRGVATRPSTPVGTPSFEQFFLPEFMRSLPQAPMPYTGSPPGSAPPGPWEIDTFGEPGTTGGGIPMAAGTVMLPAVRGMGTIALQTTVNAMRSQGLRASVGWLAGIIKKFGPAAAVGFLASWVEDQIAQRAVFEAYAHKGRRMNPANAKALRRSLRRLGAFDRLCARVKHCQKRYKVCR